MFSPPQAHGQSGLTATAAFVRHVARHGLRAALEDVGNPPDNFFGALWDQTQPPSTIDVDATAASPPRNGRNGSTTTSGRGGHSARTGRSAPNPVQSSPERKDTNQSRRGRPVAGDMRAKRGRGAHVPSGRVPVDGDSSFENEVEQEPAAPKATVDSEPKPSSKSRRRRRRPKKKSQQGQEPMADEDSEDSEEFEQYVKSMYNRSPRKPDPMPDKDFMDFAAFMSGAGLMPDDVAEMLAGAEFDEEMMEEMEGMFPAFGDMGGMGGMGGFPGGDPMFHGGGRGRSRRGRGRGRR